jgi:hypothetical protein
MTVRQTFWSRRKQAVEAEARQEVEARLATEEAEALAIQEQKADDDLLEELGLPDPDTLKAGDDFSAFMAKSVPTRLRNRALRKLWVSNPVLANLDDLVDYAEDYRTAGLTGDVVQTTYQVGKGLMKHVEELARIEEEAAAPADAEAQTDIVGQDPQEEEAEELAASDTATHPAEDTEEETAVATPKRRMRFVVEANA